MKAFPVSSKVNDPMQNDLSVIQCFGAPVFKETKAPIVVRKKEKYIPSNFSCEDQVRMTFGIHQISFKRAFEK
ncbi:MAG: hypothetical protein PF541_02590 [Prolixibacteraceae bacterium]|nr:hypothetical protein [Prolixibacteraceae bacterium]